MNLSGLHLNAAAPAAAPAGGATGTTGMPMRQAPSGGAMLTSLIPFALIFVVFYFLLIAPQRKQQKELERMLSALKKGDRVVTSGGLHGIIVDFKENEHTVVLEVAAGVRVTVSRSAVTTVKQAQGQVS